MLQGRAHVAELLVYLSLGTVLGTRSITVYAPLNTSVNIDIPNLKLEPGESVKWMSGPRLIAKSKLKDDVKVDGFTLFTNGSLLVPKVSEPRRNFSVEVYNKDGKLQKTGLFILIGIEPLSEPIISYTCNETMEISCRVARGQVDTLLVLMDGKKVGEGKSAKTVAKKTSIEMDRNLLLKCVATNNVSQESSEVVIVCPTELDILLIGCIAGAGVIFIIFLPLLIYCVRRCCKKHYRKRISEEEVELPSMRAPQEARRRQLPEPRNRPTCPTPYNPQPQPRHQQRKRPQPKSSPHQKMSEDQPMRQQKTMQRQAVSQQNTLQGQAVSQQNTLQGQAVSQQYTLQGQAMSQETRMQGQSVSQQKRKPGQPAAQQRILQGHQEPQHLVQVYPASQQQKAQGQLASQNHQLPQLPPHHPSSVSQERTSRTLPHSQSRSSPHRTAERQQQV